MATVADETTRLKLLETASEVFAAQGFHAATIREICTRAEANVAAVNYHFRDKLGLYTEVLRESLGEVHESLRRSAQNPAGKPEEQLRHLVAAMLHAIASPDRPARKVRIMMHELVQPSPALMEVVNQVMRPNYNLLRGIIGKILKLPPEHDTTRLCAHSIIGQVVHYAHARPVIEVLWPDLKLTEKRFEQVAAHIADFSLCGIKSRARKVKQKNQE